MGIEQLNFVGNDGLVQPFREDVAFVRPLLRGRNLNCVS